MRKKRGYYRLRKMRNSHCRWTNHDLRKTQIPQSLHPPMVSIPNHSGQERLQRKMHPHCQPTAYATFKMILGFINMGIFLARPYFSHHPS